MIRQAQIAAFLIALTCSLSIPWESNVAAADRLIKKRVWESVPPADAWIPATLTAGPVVAPPTGTAPVPLWTQRCSPIRPPIKRFRPTDLQRHPPVKAAPRELAKRGQDSMHSPRFEASKGSRIFPAAWEHF